MPSLSELPSNLSRSEFIKALVKVGFEINTRGGKGSHIKVIWPANGKGFSVQDKFHKKMLYVVVKEIESMTPVTWEQIKKHI